MWSVAISLKPLTFWLIVTYIAVSLPTAEYVYLHSILVLLNHFCLKPLLLFLVALFKSRLSPVFCSSQVFWNNDTRKREREREREKRTMEKIWKDTHSDKQSKTDRRTDERQRLTSVPGTWVARRLVVAYS